MSYNSFCFLKYYIFKSSNFRSDDKNGINEKKNENYDNDHVAINYSRLLKCYLLPIRLLSSGNNSWAYYSVLIECYLWKFSVQLEYDANTNYLKISCIFWRFDLWTKLHQCYFYYFQCFWFGDRKHVLEPWWLEKLHLPYWPVGLSSIHQYEI
jgi:hypothetical protein